MRHFIILSRPSPIQENVSLVSCVFELLEWFIIADTLQHIASVAMMEESGPEKKDGTLWDRDELVIRFLLEEGKLNMLTRLLVDFKNGTRGSDAASPSMSLLMSRFAGDSTAATIRIRSFEASLGLLLKCAFGSIESLQICDVQALLQHSAQVLQFALERPEVSFSF